MSEVLRYHPDRTSGSWDDDELTGILVRAQRPDGRWDNADIAQLDRTSLIAWLRSRGGDNSWAENVVLHLLGHEMGHPDD